MASVAVGTVGISARAISGSGRSMTAIAVGEVNGDHLGWIAWQGVRRSVWWAHFAAALSGFCEVTMGKCRGEEKEANGERKKLIFWPEK